MLLDPFEVPFANLQDCVKDSQSNALLYIAVANFYINLLSFTFFIVVICQSIIKTINFFQKIIFIYYLFCLINLITEKFTN